MAPLSLFRISGLCGQIAMLGSTSDLSKDNAREILKQATAWKKGQTS